MRVTADEMANAEALGLLLGAIALGAWVVGGWIARCFGGRAGPPRKP